MVHKEEFEIKIKEKIEAAVKRTTQEYKAQVDQKLIEQAEAMERNRKDLAAVVKSLLSLEQQKLKDLFDTISSTDQVSKDFVLAEINSLVQSGERSLHSFNHHEFFQDLDQ